MHKENFKINMAITSFRKSDCIYRKEFCDLNKGIYRPEESFYCIMRSALESNPPDRVAYEAGSHDDEQGADRPHQNDLGEVHLHTHGIATDSGGSSSCGGSGSMVAAGTSGSCRCAGETLSSDSNGDMGRARRKCEI
jgi:hypothetical protein